MKHFYKRVLVLIVLSAAATLVCQTVHYTAQANAKKGESATEQLDKAAAKPVTVLSTDDPLPYPARSVTKPAPVPVAIPIKLPEKKMNGLAFLKEEKPLVKESKEVVYPAPTLVALKKPETKSVEKAEVKPVDTTVTKQQEKHSEKPDEKPVDKSLLKPQMTSANSKASSVPAPEKSVRNQVFSDVVDATIYAWPLLLMNEMEKEMTDSVYFAPVNRMAYIPALPTPRIPGAECPNVDSLHSLVWFDLSKGPQVICLPHNAKHSYIVEMLDAWTNVIDSFGRDKGDTFPLYTLQDRSVHCFVLIGPNSKAKIPQGMKVITAPTNMVWFINRVLIGSPRTDGRTDLASASRTLYEFETLSLKHFEKDAKPIGDEKADKTTRTAGESRSRLLYLMDYSSPIRYSQELARTQATAEPEINVQTEEAVTNAERTIDRETQNTLEQDSGSSAMEDANVSETLELNTPQTQYYYRKYRFRPGYVRYMQQVPVAKNGQSITIAVQESTPAVPNESANTPEKPAPRPSVEKNLRKEVKRVDQEIKAIPAEIKTESKKVEKKTDKLESTVAEKGKKAASDLENFADNLLSFAKKTWRTTREISLDSFDYGKETLDYFDRKAKRDFRGLESRLGGFFDAWQWSRRPAERLEHMTAIEFFTEFAELLKTNPPVPQDLNMLALLARIGIVPGESFQPKKIDPAVLHAFRFAVPYAQSKIQQTALYSLYQDKNDNGWNVYNNFGKYGTDYLRRAIVANEFPGANVAKEILYPFTMVDGNGKFLNGANDYVLHFNAKELPPANLLWSLTLYNAEHYLVPNELRRYAIRSNMPLVYNPDGSLDLFISHKKPEKVSNWLPAPKDNFMLMLRLYQPQETALNGQWKIPAVKMVQ